MPALQEPRALCQCVPTAGGGCKAVKLAAGQHTPPTLPRREQGDPARRESRRTLEISGRIYEKVSHPRWNSVLVGPRAVVVSEEAHLSGRAGPTAGDGQCVVSGGDHEVDAGKEKENDVSTDFFPAVSDSCVAGVTAKVEETDQPVDAESLNLCSDESVVSGQNTVDDRLTSAMVSKTGGGDVEGEMVGVRTPLVCPLASVGFMGYELLGSINRHAVVAYVDSGSTVNYISEAVA